MTTKEHQTRFTDEQRARVKRCPWCGNTPRLFSGTLDDGNPLKILAGFFAIGCEYRECPVKPASETRYRDIEKAIAEWNSWGIVVTEPIRPVGESVAILSSSCHHPATEGS